MYLQILQSRRLFFASLVITLLTLAACVAPPAPATPGETAATPAPAAESPAQEEHTSELQSPWMLD